MRHRVMYVVQRACRAGQRGTERTCENGADRQFRNTFRKNGSIREIRKEIATIREENLGIVGNERRKGLSGGNGGTAGRRRHQSASRAVGRADGRSESEILAKAQQTAQNSGYGMVQYHYCVVTNGEVGSVEDFGSVKPTLTYERGALIREEVQTFSLWPLLLNGYRYSKARGVHVQHQCSGCGS